MRYAHVCADGHAGMWRVGVRDIRSHCVTRNIHSASHSRHPACRGPGRFRHAWEEGDDVNQPPLEETGSVVATLVGGREGEVEVNAVCGLPCSWINGLSPDGLWVLSIDDSLDRKDILILSSSPSSMALTRSTTFEGLKMVDILLMHLPPVFTGEAVAACCCWRMAVFRFTASDGRLQEEIRNVLILEVRKADRINHKGISSIEFSHTSTSTNLPNI